MKIFMIAYFTAIKNIKDVKTLLFVVLLPILLIIILGTALDEVHAPQSLPKAEIAFMSEDSGVAAVQVAEFLGGQMREFVDLRGVEDYEEGIAFLDEGQVESFVYLTEDFGESLSSGQEAEIQVFSNTQNPLAKSLIENYINGVNGANAIFSLGGNPAGASFFNHVESIPITTDGIMPRAIDYYAVQTLLQVLIIGALFGIAAVREDEEQNTRIRVKSAPLKEYEIITGRTIANVLVLFAQALFVMAFAKYVYQANWGGSVFINLSVIFIFVVFANGLGMLLGTLIRNSFAAIGSLWGIMIVFSITGGAFGGTVNDTLAKLSPNHYAATAIFNNVFAGSTQVIRSSITILLMATVAVYVLTLVLGRRRFA